MADRVAVLIGNRTFEPDSGLAGLKYPALDVEAMAKLLRDPEIGRFDDVIVLVDQPSGAIKLGVERAFRRNPGAFVLIFYSGHGKVSDANRLYLAARDTHEDALVATAVRFDDLIEMKENAGQARVGVMLDCCFAGLGQDDVKGSEADEVKALVGGKGIFFIGASGATQPAKEDDALGHGLLTAAIVDGLRDGGAARDNGGMIRVSDLFVHCTNFISARARQTPVCLNKIAGEELVVAFAKPKIDVDELAAIRDKLKWCRDFRLLEGDELRRLETWFSRTPVPVAKRKSLEAGFIRFVKGELSLPDLDLYRDRSEPDPPVVIPARRPEPLADASAMRARANPFVDLKVATNAALLDFSAQMLPPDSTRRMLLPLWCFAGMLAMLVGMAVSGDLRDPNTKIGFSVMSAGLAAYAAYDIVQHWKASRAAVRAANIAAAWFLLALAAVPYNP